MDFENIAIGKNIARFRRLKEKKAFDVAQQLGMTEANYTKYERGETAITIDFIKRVADILEIEPLKMISSTPNNIIQQVTNSPIAIQENSTFQTVNEKQTEMMIQLMESVVKLNERIVVLQEKK
jgi:transcriptional regulator with XRE-family HTH domain